MSDGPHRSLPMSRSWKRLAEFADNGNFGPPDICGAAAEALRECWRDDVPASVVEGVRGVFLQHQAGLFAEQRVEQLELLRPMAAGHGLARLFVDCASEVLNSGSTGETALVEAATNALFARAARAARQVEEHYCREATTPRAQNVRARLEEGIRDTDVHAVAREILAITPQTTQRRPPKHEGLDDGVSL